MFYKSISDNIRSYLCQSDYASAGTYFKHSDSFRSVAESVSHKRCLVNERKLFLSFNRKVHVKWPSNIEINPCFSLFGSTNPRDRVFYIAKMNFTKEELHKHLIVEKLI